MGIRSYGDRRTKKFAAGARGLFPAAIEPKIRRVLTRLEHGATPAELEASGRQVHRLTGNRKGAYAVAVSGRYRVVFYFADGDAYDVEALDYHRS